MLPRARGPKARCPGNVPHAESGEVQNAQRRAAIGTSLRHSGHFLVVGSGDGSPRRWRAMMALTGTTTKKYTAAATSRNDNSAFRKSPMRKALPFTVNT